ncbi:MAG TPA: MAE_28990/MAE_18760 family HEPN-like nuclease [Casimicrobium sp.]|nr:MAE_28990/MAE_18760 family HEPN-like nuclease [Casimicrobium sp.]
MSNLADFYVKQIESDLSWREQEMAILRKQLHQTAVGSQQETAFLRTNLAMVYAHYEGFCKYALGVYVDALERLALKRTDLKWSIASHSLGALYAELRNISDEDKYFTTLLTDLDRHLNDPATYKRPDNIANLWPDLLMSWQKRFGLDSTNVLNEKVRLESLVNNRNQIAHGKKLVVANRAELDSHAYAATLAMHEVAVGIADALENRLYARSSKVMTIVAHAVA